MKKNLLALTLLGLAVMPAMAFAACDPTNPATCTAPDKSIPAAITTLLNLFFGLIVLVSVFYILLAAYNFITAGGDKAKTETAINSVRNAAIGIIIALLAIGLSKFMSGIFG